MVVEMGSHTTGQRLDDVDYVLLQGDRSSANPRTAFAKKFGLGQKNLGLTYFFFVVLKIFVAIYAFFEAFI